MASSVDSSKIGAARGSTQYLWNLIEGRIVVLSDDVVNEELKENLDRIVAGLTYYAPYEPEEGEEPVKFPNVTKIKTRYSTQVKEIEDAAKEAAGKPVNDAQEEGVRFDMVRKAVAQNLDISLEVATELVVGYMMYDYKGQKTSYQEIADTRTSFYDFLKGLTKYYKQERYCLLLCTQAILADMGEDRHKFFSVIESIRTNITYKKWCWGLLRSFALAQDEQETVEIFHSLTLIMYKMPNETIPEFFTFFAKSGFSQIRNSETIKMAEGAAMYTALIVSGLTDCCNGVSPEEFSKPIAEFLENNFVPVMGNSYNFAPILAAIEIFCKGNEILATKLRRMKFNIGDTFKSMLNLAERYEKGSLHDRHSLSVVISASIFEAFEALLAGYDMSHFGTNREAFLIFATILKHNLVAENFLTGTPLALSALYTDATTLFPVDIQSSLHLWKSLCMSVRSHDVCNTIVKGVAKMQCVAEHLSDSNIHYIRRSGSYKVENISDRKLYGYNLEKGTGGSLTQSAEGDCVVWCLPPTANWSAFEVLRFVTQTMADELERMRDRSLIPVDYSNFNYAPDELHATSTFLMEFWRATDEQVPELKELLYPVCAIMEHMLRYKTDVTERATLITDLLGVVTAVNEFSTEVSLFNYIYDAIPGSETVGIVEEILLGREGFSASDCEVGLAFLKMISSFAENEKFWKLETRQVFRSKFLKCIDFVAQNIVLTCAKWRLGSAGIRNELFLKCFQIFIQLFSKDDNQLLSLKRRCLKYLVAPSSCLVAALQIEETHMHESIIKPTVENRLHTVVMTTALKLLLRLMRFEIGTFKAINETMDGMMIRILGRLFRHRLIPSIPTLTMKILKEVAHHTSISLLACFGSDEAAFRDVIIQRLELPSEDINLKVSVLEFLTVVSQSQVGVIECFFSDGILESNIVDLMQDNDDLAVASLGFFRSMFLLRLPLPAACTDFWLHMMSPIKRFRKGGNIQMITSTVHILTLEMFLNGFSDNKMTPEVTEFLESEQFVHVVEAALTDTSEERGKCIAAIKHFFTLILGRSELTHLLPPKTIVRLQSLVLQKFWECDLKESAQLTTNLAELASILTIPDCASKELLAELLRKMVACIGDHSLGTRLALLCMLNKLYSNLDEAVAEEDVEKTFRIIKRLFDYCVKYLEEHNEHRNINSILSVAASILSTIMEKQHIDVWGTTMSREMIPHVLIVLAGAAISRKKAPDVVTCCLSVFITLADNKFSCTMVPWQGLSKSLYLQLYRFIYTDNNRESAWDDVFNLTLHLNSTLLRNLKYDFLDEALAFWGFYAEKLNLMLTKMMDVSDICVGIDDTEKGYNEMKTIMQSASFVLNDIRMMSPYLTTWFSVQPNECQKSMQAVLYILQEACALLQQPYLLQSSFGAKPKQSCLEPKISPRLLEIQNKLFHVCNIILQIIVELKTKEQEYFDRLILLPVAFQIAHLSLKSLFKHDKKTPANASSQCLLAIVEKVTILIYMYTVPILDDPTQDPKFQSNFRREMVVDVSSLCDGVRRLSIPISAFHLNLCTQLDQKFK